jgi:hypothetical protein
LFHACSYPKIDEKLLPFNQSNSRANFLIEVITLDFPYQRQDDGNHCDLIDDPEGSLHFHWTPPAPVMADRTSVPFEMTLVLYVIVTKPGETLT